MNRATTWVVKLTAETAREPQAQDLREITSHLGGTSPSSTFQSGKLNLRLVLQDQDEGFFTGAESAIIRATSLVERALAAADLRSFTFVEIQAVRGYPAAEPGIQPTEQPCVEG